MIEVHGVSVRAGDFELKNISFSIPTGGYGILMGRTGCGKTTLIEAICGLRTITQGNVCLMERDVTQLKPAERNIGFVPQDGALFRTMTVRAHLAFALEIRGWEKEAIEKRVSELAETLGIESLLDRTPVGLSGGEQQRVALGRALSFKPPVLCLDEPLSAIDFDTRLEMCALLEEVKAATGVTVIHITHDRNEAARLADYIYELSHGEVSPVYDGPGASAPDAPE